jgi:hypothetical protein
MLRINFHRVIGGWLRHSCDCHISPLRFSGMRSSLVRGKAKVHRLTCVTSFVLFRNVLAQFQSVVLSHVNKIDSIPDLWIFGCHNSRATNHFVVQRQRDSKSGSHFYREHGLDVAPAKADFIRRSPHRRCTDAGQFHWDSSFHSWIAPSLWVVGCGTTHNGRMIC